MSDAIACALARVVQMMASNPASRPTASEILSEPIILNAGQPLDVRCPFVLVVVPFFWILPPVHAFLRVMWGCCVLAQLPSEVVAGIAAADAKAAAAIAHTISNSSASSIPRVPSSQPSSQHDGGLKLATPFILMSRSNSYDSAIDSLLSTSGSVGNTSGVNTSAVAVVADAPSFLQDSALGNSQPLCCTPDPELSVPSSHERNLFPEFSLGFKPDYEVIATAQSDDDDELMHDDDDYEPLDISQLESVSTPLPFRDSTPVAERSFRDSVLASPAKPAVAPPARGVGCSPARPPPLQPVNTHSATKKRAAPSTRPPVPSYHRATKKMVLDHSADDDDGVAAGSSHNAVSPFAPAQSSSPDFVSPSGSMSSFGLSPRPMFGYGRSGTESPGTPVPFTPTDQPISHDWTT